VPFAVEGLLQLLVGAIERAVVPVEAAAPFGGTNEERHEHAAVERASLVGRQAFVCAREDLRGRLALQVGDGLAHIVALEEAVGMRFDEATYERAVLIERRPSVRPVFLEREREVGAVEGRERAEAETAERVVEMRRTHCNSPSTPSAPSLLFGSRDTSTRCARPRPAGTSG
jgi:hypothetical protein